MNRIEQIVEPKNGAIDLHVDVPAEWDGKQIRVVLEEVSLTKPPKVDLTRFEGKFAHLPSQETDKMLNELAAMRDEWSRDI